MLIDTIANRQSCNQRIMNGILCTLDESRSKWLSVDRKNISFGIDHRNIHVDRWMAVTGGAYSNTTGYILTADSTIIKIGAYAQNLSTCVFRIRKNGLALDIASLVLTNEQKKIEDFNVDMNEGDVIQCYLEVTAGNVDFPTLLLEYATTCCC